MDKGLTFVIMGIAMWVMYTWVQEGRRSQDEQIEELKLMVRDCNQSKRDRIEQGIIQLNTKVDKLLTSK